MPGRRALAVGIVALGVGVALPSGAFAFGTFGAPTPYPTTHIEPIAVAVANFDHKLGPDLVVADKDVGTSAVDVLLNNGAGLFAAASPTSVASGPFDVAVADFNRDGKPDVVTVNDFAQGVSVLLGKGGTQFKPRSDIQVGEFPQALTTGDLNGDHRADIVASVTGPDKLAVLLGKGNGKFSGPKKYNPGDDPQDLVIADVTGDGRKDVVVTSNSSTTPGVSILRGLRHGKLHDPKRLPLPHGARDVVAADFNKDHKLDLAASVSFDDVDVWLAKGHGRFKQPVSYDAGTFTSGIAVGDLDRDGIKDIAVADQDGDKASVLIGKPKGKFLDGVEYAAGDRPGDIAIAKFNGDKGLDLALPVEDDQAVVVLMNQP